MYFGIIAQCIDGDLRFVEEGTDRGPLLICFRSLWHETCSSSFNEVDARIACRQLGFVEGSMLGLHCTSRIRY